MNRAQRRQLERAKAHAATQAASQLAAAYRCVPAMNCKGLCFEACGPIYMSPEEKRRIEAHLGHPIGKVDPHTLTCPLLTADKRCSIYELRPMICRIYGVQESLRCEHGCEPTRVLSDDEAGYLMGSIGTDGSLHT